MPRLAASPRRGRGSWSAFRRRARASTPRRRGRRPRPTCAVTLPGPAARSGRGTVAPPRVRDSAWTAPSVPGPYDDRLAGTGERDVRPGRDPGHAGRDVGERARPGRALGEAEGAVARPRHQRAAGAVERDRQARPAVGRERRRRPELAAPSRAAPPCTGPPSAVHATTAVPSASTSTSPSRHGVVRRRASIGALQSCAAAGDAPGPRPGTPRRDRRARASSRPRP